MTIKLNQDQLNLIQALLEFWEDPSRNYFVISGQAGVGKTTCMKYFVNALKEKHGVAKIAMSAPTNCAVSVLKNAVQDKGLTYKTIYSLLGLRMMANGAIKELTDSGKEDISNFDMVLIDEGSMASTILLDYLEKKIQLSDTKVVFIGDKEQLPPVGELESPIWKKYGCDYELTEVMRHQNSILDFVQSIRANPNPIFESPGKQVKIDSEDTFMSSMKQAAEAGLFHTGRAKAIAWRNMTVDFLNDFIRNNNEKTKSTDAFVIEDRIVFREPLMKGEELVASTDQEGIVTSVKVVNHNAYPMLKAWSLGIRLDDGGSTVNAYVIHQESVQLCNDLLEELSNAKKWHLFWKMKEAFSNITHSYALTAHRSQGSSFHLIYVDAGDIMLNRNIKERTKCLYVGCSRASKMLRIFP